MHPYELATVIAILGRPKTMPTEAVRARDRAEARESATSFQPRRVSPFRRAIGFWLIGLGGAVVGR